MSALTDAAIEHEISSGMLSRAAVDIAHRQMLAAERVAAALEKIIEMGKPPRMTATDLDLASRAFHVGAVTSEAT